MKKLYMELAKKQIENKEDLERILYYYEYFASFYPQIVDDKELSKLFCQYNLSLEDADLENMLNNGSSLSSDLMQNKQIRGYVKDPKTKFNYVAVDARNMGEGGNPHQNSHEHYYTIEVCRVESGYAIAAKLLSDGNVKLDRYNPGEYWTSVPGIVHNTSLKDGSHTTTLKTPSILPDWYGTGNVVNSELSYFVDSRSKTLDLDQMNYVINKHDGIVDKKIVSELHLDQKWNDIMSKQEISPYEVLITPENKEIFRSLLLETRNNDLAAFYANLANGNIKEAARIAKLYGTDLDKAINALDGDRYNIEKAKQFADTKKLIKK